MEKPKWTFWPTWYIGHSNPLKEELPRKGNPSNGSCSCLATPPRYGYWWWAVWTSTQKVPFMHLLSTLQQRCTELLCLSWNSRENIPWSLCGWAQGPGPPHCASGQSVPPLQALIVCKTVVLRWLGRGNSHKAQGTRPWRREHHPC